MKKADLIIQGTNKNEYGPHTPAVLSHVLEGPHGFTHIIGEDEVPPTGLDSLPAHSVTRKSEKGA